MIRLDKTQGKRTTLHSKENDFQYWSKQSYEKRLEALDYLRDQYIRYKYGTRPRLQRVYTVIERKPR